MNTRIAWLCALALGALTLLVVGQAPISGDEAILQFAMSLRSPWLTGIIGILSFLGSAVPALLITLAVSSVELLRARQLRLAAGWATIAFTGALVCNIVLRTAIGRQPPRVETLPNLLPELQASFQRFSFPSGHAAVSLVAFAALAVLAWPHARWRYPVLVTTGIIIFGVGFGRAYLGVHWPSDVLGGNLLGLCWLALALSLKARIGAKKGWI